MAKEEEVASSNPNFLPVESWDFGYYSCEDAEEKLMAIGRNKGQFIVRNDRYAGIYSLSVRANNPQKGDYVKHYKLQAVVGSYGFYIHERSVFPTLSELVRHYQMNSDGLCCILTKACQRSPSLEEEGQKYSPELKDEASLKDSPGLKEKLEEVAASEQDTSKGKDRLLLRSNKKRKWKTWIAKFLARVCSLIAYVPKNKWKTLVILLGILLSGANGQGVDVQREDFRSITIATSETEVATYSVPTPVDGANYLIYTRDGNKPGSFKCTPEFVEVNKSCTLEVGDKDKTECEGLQIFRNDTHTHLTVDGSKLTHDCTVVCILQHFPEFHTLYPLAVFKEHDQDNVQQEFPRNIAIAPNETIDATDLVPIPAPDCTYWKKAFDIVVTLLCLIICVILVIVYIRERLRNKLIERVPTKDPEEDLDTTALDNLDRTNGHAVQC